ncbi:flagellar hook-basal body complex protein FliE [Sporosarcina sp. HYO08]|uniref:flagellar hook-basal body complex protein FliE n=1 Tax=Sporosarcina sp. HYO08 TaxID=1759557 RepID=UPI000791FC26|nr:flagellar hook-basal body complex protein FliE [Sporosarcina sp. HYO08]KXH79977.1 flagellar hook-basal body protein FliE [Sporosarcina sp. HYO08]
MAIQSVFQSHSAVNLSPIVSKKSDSSFEAGQNFGQMFKQALNEVNEKQQHSDLLTEKLALGKNVDLHEVMIAAQKASIALNATMEIRNKVVEAYQEISRMPI